MEGDIQGELYARKGNDIHNWPKLNQKKQIMAILNCTPDSFYDQGRYFDPEKAVQRGIELAEEGADLIDIGGESTRPFSQPVSVEEELRRVTPVMEELFKLLSIPLSIDSSKPEVVEVALQKGARFINDVTGFTDPRMRSLAKEYHVPICLMHMQKNPQEMQRAPHYPRGVVTEIYHWFEKQLSLLLQEGISQDQIYLDVGIGFGKSVDDNLHLLQNLEIFTQLGSPILIGLSRKSFMQKILKINGADLLPTTLALNTMSLLKGAAMIRVHDVKEHKAILSILERMEKME